MRSSDGRFILGVWTWAVAEVVERPGALWVGEPQVKRVAGNREATDSSCIKAGMSKIEFQQLVFSS